MMYYFYIANVLMPVSPEKITIKTKNKNKTLTLVSGGEINIPKAPGLTEISFDLLLPSVQYPFARYDKGFKTPDYYLELFASLKETGSPCSLIVIRSTSAEAALRNAARFGVAAESVRSLYDANHDGQVNSADARILLRSAAGNTILTDTYMMCTIEDYTIKEDAEKHGEDIAVSLKLKQYREYGIKTAQYTLKK